jgi:hypothetical protein
MNEPTAQPETAESTVFLNSPNGWFEIHRESGIFNDDSGLIVVSGRQAELSEIGASAYVAMQFGRRSDNGESRFKKTVLLIPPGQKADKLRIVTLNNIQVKMQEAGMSELMVKVLPGFCDARSLVTLSGMQLVKVVGELPADSACIIFCPELYRFIVSVQQSPANQPRRLADINRENLEILLNSLAQVVQNNNVMIVFLCGKANVNIADIAMPDEVNIYVMESSNGDSDRVPAFELAPLLKAFHEGGWPSVKSHKGFNPDSTKQIAFALSEAFAMEQNLPLAWAAMEPYIAQAGEWTVGTQLYLARAAQIAGNMEASHKLLMQAAEEEVQTAEELFSILQLADTHGELELFQQMHSKICRSFPDIPLTQRSEYLRLFKKRDFAAALKIAENLGLTTEMAQCRAFISPSIQSDEFLDEMLKQGDLEQGLMSCAEEALFRQHACQAIVWARKVQPRSSLFERSCLIRFRALRIVFRKGAKIFALTELENLMSFVAAQPGNFTLRSELEKLLDYHLEEPLVTVSLSTLLAQLIEKQALRDDESIKQARSINAAKNKNAGAQTEQEFEEFIEGLTKTWAALRNPHFLVGKGKLDVSLRRLVGPTLIRGMAEAVVNEGLRKDLDSAIIILHAICLACNEFGEPSTDFAVLQSIIDYQASIGAAQQARDLADTALRFWPQSQPVFFTWRVSQGWAALAEACLRSGNKMAALRYLCLSLLANQEPALDVELLRRWYRLASRIFRDLHLAPFAMTCIGLERVLLNKINHSGQELSLEILKLQILLPGILASSGDAAIKALEHSEKLLQKGEESESFALAGIQASIIGVISAKMVPQEILRNFQKRTDLMPEPLRSRLKITAASTLTKEDVATLIESLPEAQDHRYLAYQIASALPALSNALNHSVHTDDKELFLIAAGAFAQPSLGVQIAHSPRDEKREKASSILRTTTQEGFESGTFDSIPQFSFSRLAGISIAQLQRVLGDSEAALILASEPSFKPLGMLISHDSVSSPRPISPWSLDSFANWKSTHNEKLKWFKPADFVPGINSLEPPVQVIKEVVENLSIGLLESPDKLTILPPAHLFGFTWGLSPHKGGFLAECTSLAIAPSAAWLVASRTSTWSGDPARKAWIGSAETTDYPLMILRSHVEVCLKEHCFLESRDFTPTNFARCQLAFIGAHGGTGMGGFFRSISDRVNHFSPAELAQMLAGCGCVVLAVCSGGQSDRQSGSEETLGLVTALFRVGVRCVIAPPWPLHIDVVKYWLPAFLKALDDKATTGEAAVKARDAVRRELDHPCAWGQMHLYGDQNFRLTGPRTQSAEPTQ